jgi:hypothetical protein
VIWRDFRHGPVAERCFTLTTLSDRDEV